MGAPSAPSVAHVAPVQRVPAAIHKRFEVREYRHASAILEGDFPSEWKDLLAVLGQFTLPKSSIVTPGGNKSAIAKALNGAFRNRGWIEHSFNVRVHVDQEVYPSPTHGVDYYKNMIAIETEWNNKDPFYDRDLNNYRLLHQLRVISVGVIITRSDELQTIFNQLGRGSSYGESTTHLRKLTPKIEGGGAGGCPLLVFGIKPSCYDPNS